MAYTGKRKIVDGYTVGIGDSIGRKCEVCGDDNWHILDNLDAYYETCYTCCDTKRDNPNKRRVYVKQDFVDNFECPDCGSLSGTLEENNYKLGVRCSHCGKLVIYIVKPECRTDNRRMMKEREARAVLRCPKCLSTSVTTGARGVNWGLGLLGASKTVNRCGKCGYTWKPRG